MGRWRRFAGYARFFDVDKMRFLTSVEGIMYAESESGAMNEAFVRCPIAQDIDETSGRTSASGNRVISVGPEDTVLAEIRCDSTRGLCKCGEPAAILGNTWRYFQDGMRRELTFSHEGRLQQIGSLRP